MSPSDERIQKLVEQVVRAARPLRILVFGSLARGEGKAGSDIDLLVVVPEGTHRRRTAQRLYREIRGVGAPFDLIVATPGDLERHGQDPALVYREALEHGVEVYAA